MIVDLPVNSQSADRGVAFGDPLTGGATEDRGAAVLAAARQALERRDWTEARQHFSDLQVFPEYAAEAQYGLGWLEVSEGFTDRALERFGAAIRLDPRHANAWYALGRLAEENSVEQAVAYYRQVLAIDHEHYGARERLAALVPEPAPRADPPSWPDPPSVPEREARSMFAPAPAERPADRLAVADRPADHAGIVQFLEQDSSPVSKQALERISAIERSAHPRFTAHLQRLLRRFVLMVGVVAALAVVLEKVTPITVGSHTIHFYWRDVRIAIGVAIAVWAASAIWRYLNCVLNTITIANARVTWTRGVVSKHRETLDLWTVTDIELDRNMLQRVTGDGVLTFKGTRHDTKQRRGEAKPLRMPGVARGEALDRIYSDLLDLKFLLRANPALKGIIQ